ncbi:MAG: MbcA/ParS/Xre antitoxin family protein [Pollutimonas bauzanensis]
MVGGQWQELQGRLAMRLRATLGAGYPPAGRRHEYVAPRILAALQDIQAGGKLSLPMVPKWPAGQLSRSDVAALYRLLRTVYLAELVFADAERARYWLCAPKARLQGRVPLQIAAHVEHAHQLEQWLMEINEGCHR